MPLTGVVPLRENFRDRAILPEILEACRGGVQEILLIVLLVPPTATALVPDLLDLGKVRMGVRNFLALAHLPGRNCLKGSDPIDA